jgi:hypothetical protein
VRTMASRARGGRRCCGPGMAQVNGIMGSGTLPGEHRHGLWEDNVVAGLGMASHACRRCLRGQ